MADPFERRVIVLADAGFESAVSGKRYNKNKCLLISIYWKITAREIKI